MCHPFVNHTPLKVTPVTGFTVHLPFQITHSQRNHLAMSLSSGSLLRSAQLVFFRQPFRCAGIKKKKNYAETPSRYRPSVLVKTLRGFQFNDGDYVYKGDILVRQLGMEIYPGESVKLDPETWNLVALSNGRFTISTEKLSPFPDSPLYDKVKDGEVIYKPFVHVIGDPIEPIYKLKRIL
ncbi:unnamed protein product [Schistosoma mattheei]|uniref:Uncharacterized protein n=3 Tax=Schistosoma mattheei TaxID=31246 RepID=A0AA85BUY0_9TREM|nr:unnamed protein product [Schistosoma mattheei]